MTDDEARVAFTTWIIRFGLSNEQAAKLLGCHRNTVSKYQSGISPVPRYMLLAATAIAEKLEPPADFRVASRWPFDTVAKLMESESAARLARFAAQSKGRPGPRAPKQAPA